MNAKEANKLAKKHLELDSVLEDITGYIKYACEKGDFSFKYYPADARVMEPLILTLNGMGYVVSKSTDRSCLFISW